MRSKFLSYLSELPILNQIRLHRCYFNSSSQIVSAQLHAFSDASELAYSYVAYLRTEYESGEIGVRFVTSKSKVTPIKPQSVPLVPRLELMEACILAEQLDNVYNVLSSEYTELSTDKFCWVDLSATLCWIRNEKPWKKFIRDQVKLIRSVTDPQRWRYVARAPESCRFKGGVIFTGRGAPENWGDQVPFLRSKGGIKRFFQIKKEGSLIFFKEIK